MGAGPEEVADTFPDWYVTVQAAKWLGVAPWDLMKQPLYWTHWGLAGRSAENKAEKILTERARAKAKRK
jgi:hypothetical protein